MSGIFESLMIPSSHVNVAVTVNTYLVLVVTLIYFCVSRFFFGVVVCIIQQAQLPVGPETLRYGTSDAGKTVHNEDRELEDKLKAAAVKLNVRSHKVNGKVCPSRPFLSFFLVWRTRSWGSWGSLTHVPCNVCGGIYTTKIEQFF